MTEVELLTLSSHKNNNTLRMNSVKSDCKILVTVLGILLTILEYMYVRMPTVCSILG